MQASNDFRFGAVHKSLAETLIYGGFVRINDSAAVSYVIVNYKYILARLSDVQGTEKLALRPEISWKPINDQVRVFALN